MLVDLVIYDLPNRDCHAKASNGEFFVNQNGVQNYQTLYIDKIVDIIKSEIFLLHLLATRTDILLQSIRA